MSASKREAAMVALVGVLRAAMVAPAVPSPPVVERDEIVSQTLPPNGRVVVYDAGMDAEAILSPLRYACELRADVEIIAPATSQASSAARLDLLLRAASSAIAAARTLSGAAEWMDVGAAEISVDAVSGAAPVHSATVPVTIYFTTDATPQG
jgi:hypothetical protein